MAAAPNLPAGANTVLVRTVEAKCSNAPECDETWFVTVADELGALTIISGRDVCPECGADGIIQW